MKHYRIFSFILLFICAAFGQSCSISSSGREVLDMNTDWAFYRGDVVEGSRTDLDDSGWIPVALPHIMQLEMKHCGGNSIYDGIGWYRRYFKLPAKYKDKRIVVSFEGVMTNCDVYLNGQKVTEHHGGYMGFVADQSYCLSSLHPQIQYFGYWSRNRYNDGSFQIYNNLQLRCWQSYYHFRYSDNFHGHGN